MMFSGALLENLESQQKRSESHFELGHLPAPESSVHPLCGVKALLKGTQLAVDFLATLRPLYRQMFMKGMTWALIFPCLAC